MITDTITQKIGEALKTHEEIKLSTLRLLSSALNYEFIAKQYKLSEDEELVVVRREAKKRKEAIEVYEKVKAFDRAEKEKKELSILQEFLPPEISDEEITKLVNETLKETNASGLADLGKVISLVRTKAKGAVDGAKVAQLVKMKLGI